MCSQWLVMIDDGITLQPFTAQRIAWAKRIKKDKVTPAMFLHCLADAINWPLPEVTAWWYGPNKAA